MTNYGAIFLFSGWFVSVLWMIAFFVVRNRKEELEDKIDGLEGDLESAVEVAFDRGATEWVKLNYPMLYRKYTRGIARPEYWKATL